MFKYMYEEMTQRHSNILLSNNIQIDKRSRKKYEEILVLLCSNQILDKIPLIFFTVSTNSKHKVIQLFYPLKECEITLTR